MSSWFIPDERVPVQKVAPTGESRVDRRRAWQPIDTDWKSDRQLSALSSDRDGKVLEVFASKRRDRKAVLAFLKRAMKRYGSPHSIVTDRLRSYRSAMNIVGHSGRQNCGRWLNNRGGNSHRPFRRREGAMARFRDIKTLQKFDSAHASIHNHFDLERHLVARDDFKNSRSAALAEWREIAA